MTKLLAASSAGASESVSENKSFIKTAPKRAAGAPFGYPRDFVGKRFVYLTISPRARGLSIGINLGPDRKCNFDCRYCEVDRSVSRPDSIIDCDVAGQELEETLAVVQSGALRDHAPYSNLPPELLRLRHVALSGDGEPTASPRFLQTVETVVHVRARGWFPFFKIVLITNAAHLDRTEVQAGLRLFTAQDEVWAKLDAGTQAYMDLVNCSTIPLQTVLSNILLTARKRPVVIQSLFSSIDGKAPKPFEITEFAHRLRELNEAGAKIALVQIYSATRPIASQRVQHLPLRAMSEIAAEVRRVSGLRAEVF
jgi:wyosine [tRNA(Phe)-imidazoG37] synthetase (radical SAM superfamily)